MLYFLAFTTVTPVPNFCVCGSIWEKCRGFGESNSNFKGSAAKKPFSYQSFEKRTLEFVARIQAMINNNPSESGKSIARYIGVSELLTRQILHEDIRYFSYKTALQSFSTNSSISKQTSFGFSLKRKISVWIR